MPVVSLGYGHEGKLDRQSKLSGWADDHGDGSSRRWLFGCVPGRGQGTGSWRGFLVWETGVWWHWWCWQGAEMEEAGLRGSCRAAIPHWATLPRAVASSASRKKHLELHLRLCPLCPLSTRPPSLALLIASWPHLVWPGIPQASFSPLSSCLHRHSRQYTKHAPSGILGLGPVDPFFLSHARLVSPCRVTTLCAFV